MHQDVRVDVYTNHIRVRFQLETNEEGMLIEAIAMDSDSDGKLSASEQSAYFAQLAARIREGLQISISGEELALVPTGPVELSPPAKKTFRFRGYLKPGPLLPYELEVQNDNFLDWPGRAALEVEVDGVLKVGPWSEKTSTRAIGSIAIGQPLASRVPTDWTRWSWTARLLTPAAVAVAAAAALILVCSAMLLTRSVVIRVSFCGALLLAWAGYAFVAFKASGRAPVSPDVWRYEFRAFHSQFSSALAAYHQTGDLRVLAPYASPGAVRELAAATRVPPSADEKTGTFELRRVRSQSVSILEEPKPSLFPTVRIRHTWRAIGIMRHQGHPHERIRDFTCDYTLRVTDHGLILIDCSDWHQLPDEPITE